MSNVCVFCSASDEVSNKLKNFGYLIGRLIALNNHLMNHLLTMINEKTVPLSIYNRIEEMIDWI